MNPSAIFFDFDGVILDSAGIKTEAFRQLFAAEFSGQVDAIVALHVRHSGVSRYRKFEMIYEEILEEPLSTEKRAHLGRQFEALVTDAVLACPEVPGGLSVLRKFCDEVPLFVVSGTPEDELQRIVSLRNLDRYFAQVCGSPRPKTEILRNILCDRRLDGRSCVFVGDGLTDFEAASAFKMPFIGIVPPSLTSPFPDEVATIPDLRAFDAALAALKQFHDSKVSL
jgi:phosphoglycolate phosphatase-like HAD superfamily hydrolase